MCGFCSHFEHGECDRAELCVNCKESHSARNKNCVFYKREQEALVKAHDEKISIGQARKIVNRTIKYSDMARKSKLVDKSSSSRVGKQCAQR